MNNEHAKAFYEESCVFIEDVYEQKIFESNLQEGAWFGNVAPVLYILYLNYISHYYNEIDNDEIDELCEYFADVSYKEKNLTELVRKMKNTNHDIDKIIFLFRNQSNADYGTAWSMCLPFLFQKEMDISAGIKIIEAAERVSSYRKDVEDSVTNQKNEIIKICNTISASVKSAVTREFDINKEFDVFYWGFALHLVKYYISHQLSKEMALKYISTDRDYFSQYYVKTLISLKYGIVEDATKCYTIWNHLNRIRRIAMEKMPEKINTNFLLIGAVNGMLDCIDFTEDSNQRTKAFIVISESVKEILNSIWLGF